MSSNQRHKTESNQGYGSLPLECDETSDRFYDISSTTNQRQDNKFAIQGYDISNSDVADRGYDEPAANQRHCLMNRGHEVENIRSSHRGHDTVDVRPSYRGHEAVNARSSYPGSINDSREDGRKQDENGGQSGEQSGEQLSERNRRFFDFCRKVASIFNRHVLLLIAALR